MKIDVVRLPRELKPDHLNGRVAVVLDVLRATSTIAAALFNGASEIRISDSIEIAQAAASHFTGARVLAGERQALPPPGFDLGNSPGDFTAERIGGKTIFLSTTNGTRAIVAARGAAHVLTGALVNSASTARHLASLKLDVTLLCSGTDGEFAPEDYCGAGAVVDRLQYLTSVESSPTTVEAHRLFRKSRDDLPAFLRTTQGGRNVIRAGLEADIDFAARLDTLDVAVNVSGDPPAARRIILR
jgi:2-phosphosulfolactate phosphatase